MPILGVAHTKSSLCENSCTRVGRLEDLFAGSFLTLQIPRKFILRNLLTKGSFKQSTKLLTPEIFLPYGITLMHVFNCSGF